MSAKGNLFLDIPVVRDCYRTVVQTGQDAQAKLYGQYKAAYKLGATRSYRGPSADVVRNYIAEGPINIISGLLDVTSEMTLVMQAIAELFYQYENDANGRVEEPTLDVVANKAGARRREFGGSISELNAALQQASRYIGVIPLGLDGVSDAYDTMFGALDDTRNRLHSADDAARKAADALYERIVSVKALIQNAMGHVYGGDSFSEDGASSLAGQSWYRRQTNVTLYLLNQESGFGYLEGQDAIAEDQWARGLCSDVYAYAGYSFVGGSYEAGAEGASAYAKASGALLAGNAYAQFTDYLHAKTEGKVAYGSIDAKGGVNPEEGYVGAHVDAEVGLMNVKGEVVAGSEDFNAFVSGEAKALTADGKAAFEFNEDGEFAIGFDAGASAASVKGKAGLTFLGYHSKDSNTDDEERLFGVSAGAKAGASASAAVWIESKTAIEMGPVNVNATSLKLDLEFLIGFEVDVTVPTLAIKWPW